VCNYSNSSKYIRLKFVPGINQYCSMREQYNSKEIDRIPGIENTCKVPEINLY